MRRRTAGVTLAELLVAAVIAGMITAATAQALGVAMKTSKTIETSQVNEQKRMEFEDQVTSWIRLAWLAPSTAEPISYFVGEIGPMSVGDASQIVQATTTGTTAGATTTGATSATATPSSSGGGSPAPTDNPLSNSGNADDLTFTAVGTTPPVQLFTSQDDWPTANQDFGPQGGVAEVCLSLVPQQDPGNHTHGLFLRVQRPADQDPTQGGFERVLSPDVASIGYQFYDGQNWDTTWDTRQLTPQQLPAAVRVTYRFEGDKQDHVFVVMLPYSNVTYNNPVENPPQ